MGVPAVNIGSRQTGRDRGRNLVDVPYDRKKILAAIKKQSTVGKFESDGLYGDGASGARIADLLASVELTIEKRLTY